MYINKKMRAMILSSVMSVGLIFVPTICPAGIVNGLPLPVVSVAHAEIKTYTGIGDYVLSDDVPPGDIKSKAKLYAERNALEQAGVFIGSLSVVKNAKLQDDEIVAFTAGILQIVDVQYEIIPINDKSGIAKYRATVTAQIDTDVLDKKINEWLSRGDQERAILVEQNRALQQTIDELQRRIATLEQVAINAQTPQDNTNIHTELQSIDKATLAVQKFEEGNRFYDSEDYEKAINCYNEAIELNPNNVEYYFNRCRAYYELQDYDAATADCDKAMAEIETNPKNYLINSRNIIYTYVEIIGNYLDLNKHDEANHCFNKAMEMASASNSEIVQEFIIEIFYDKKDFIRGQYYYCIASTAYTFNLDYKAIIRYANVSIDINSDDLFAYFQRGIAYILSKKYDMAIADFNKVIELSLQLSSNDIVLYCSYCMLAVLYEYIGDNIQSKIYYDKATNSINGLVETDYILHDSYHN